MIIVGLGNADDSYEHTRHNAGFWFLDQWALDMGLDWRLEKKCQAHVIKLGEHLLVKPNCYMNVSGLPVQKTLGYFKRSPQELVLVYDEMSFQPGVVRFKNAGGAGGHNGVKDVIQKVGGNFMRIRIGIGQPLDASMVSAYVLSRPSQGDRLAIDQAMRTVLQDKDRILGGEWAKLMNQHHG